MVLIVSGAPFTAPINSPEGRAATVDIRLRADEKWNRRRMISLVPWGASCFEGVTESPTRRGLVLGGPGSCVLLFTIAKSPIHGIQGSLLHGIADDNAIIKLDERMGGGQCEDGPPSHLLHVNQNFAIGTIALLATIKYHVHDAIIPNASNPLQNKVCGCDRACLIETANVNSSRERDAERFRAENC